MLILATQLQFLDKMEIL